MADPRVAQGQVAVERIDEGLRSYMLSVYNYMGHSAWRSERCSIAYIVGTTPALYEPIMTTPLQMGGDAWPRSGFVFFLSAKIQTMKLVNGADDLLGVCSADGRLVSSYHLRRTSLVPVSRGSSSSPPASFGAMSLYGYTTKRDLSGMGSFLFMGLIGVIIAIGRQHGSCRVPLCNSRSA